MTTFNNETAYRVIIESRIGLRTEFFKTREEATDFILQATEDPNFFENEITVKFTEIPNFTGRWVTV